MSETPYNIIHEGNVEKSDFKFSMISIDPRKLILSDINPREITEKNFELLTKDYTGFEEMHYLEPILIDEDLKVWSGNQRVRVALSESYTEVICILFEGLDEEKKLKLMALKNTHRGAWDWDKLAQWDDEMLELLSEWNIIDIPSINESDLDDFFTENEEKEKTSTKIILEFTQDDYNEIIEIFNKTPGSKEEIVFQALKNINPMDVYIAGSGWEKVWIKKDFFDFNRLDSFRYVSKKGIPLIKRYKNFLLDSGAFTFMKNVRKELNWNKYIEEYAQFINEHDIKKFFELDIDSVIGYENTLKLRERLESLTGKKCIPVWHKSRGLEEYKKMCLEYSYAAIGGIVTKEIKPSEHKFFPFFINIAKKNNCKLHGLGYTSPTGLEKYKFDSVDSTTWLRQKFGEISIFTGNSIKSIKRKHGKKIESAEKSAYHNFDQWIKFSKYAEDNL